MTKREKNLLSDYCEKLFLINQVEIGLHEASIIKMLYALD